MTDEQTITIALKPGQKGVFTGQHLTQSHDKGWTRIGALNSGTWVPPVVDPPTDIPGWQLIFDETFDKPCAEGQFAATYPNIYLYPWQWPDTAEKAKAGTGSFYDPNIISVHDGMLDAHLRTINGVRHVAGFGPKLGAYATPGSWMTASRLGMRTSIEAMVVGDRYYKGAWMHWPMSDIWPGDQEVDYPENNYDSTVSSYLHWPDNQQYVVHTAARWSEWHTYVNEWKPGSHWAFGLDGVEKARYTDKVPSTPHRWFIQNETNLDGALPPSTSEAHVYVRRMQVWIPA